MKPPAVPSLALLQAAAGQTVELALPDGSVLAATLQHAAPGIPMSADYDCYSAELLLAPDLQLPQAVYQLRIAGMSWPLLMTPVGFATERRGRLQAVFHAARELATTTEPGPHDE